MIGRTHRAAVSVLALVAALLAVAWLMLTGQSPPGDRRPAVMPDVIESARPAVLPVPLEAASQGTDPGTSDAPDPAALVEQGARLRIEVSADGLVVDPPIVSIARANDPGGAIRRRMGPAAVEWRGLRPGPQHLEALNGGWELSDTVIDLAEGDARTIRVTPRTSVRVRVLGARTAHAAPAYSIGVETRWVGSTGTRRLGPTFDVADPSGSCRFVGLPERSAGQELEAIRAVVVLPDSGVEESSSEVEPSLSEKDIVSEWLPAAELIQDRELLVLLPEPAIVGRITAPPGFGESIVYLLRASYVPEVWNAFSYTMLDMHANRDEVIATTATVDGEFTFSLDTLPVEPPHVLATVGNYDVSAVADSGPIVVPPTGAPIRVDLSVPPGGVIHGTLRGSVCAGRDGEPMPSAMFSATQAFALRVGDSRSRPGPRSYHGMTKPIEGGGVEFTLTALASGEYEVTVPLAARQEAQSASTIAARRLIGRALVSPGQITELVLDADQPSHGSSLCGSLRLPGGFAPAKTSIVAWRRSDGQHEFLVETEAAANGDFALADLPPGPVALGASSFVEGHHMGAIAVVPQASASCATPLILDMSHPEVRFHTAGGELERVRVEPQAGPSDASDVLNDLHVSLSFDESGSARLFGLPAGEYVAHFDNGKRIAFAVPPDAVVLTVEGL